MWVVTEKPPATMVAWLVLLTLSSLELVNGWIHQSTVMSLYIRRPTVSASLAFSHVTTHLDEHDHEFGANRTLETSTGTTRYDLGIGKNAPLGSASNTTIPALLAGPSDPNVPTLVATESTQSVPFSVASRGENWVALDPVHKPSTPASRTRHSPHPVSEQTAKPVNGLSSTPKPAPTTSRRMVARDNRSAKLRAALWDEGHYQKHESPLLPSHPHDPTTSTAVADTTKQSSSTVPNVHEIVQRSTTITADGPSPPTAFYPDIDLSIPDSVYADDGSVDLVWDLLRWDAYQEAQREPLLVSFLYSTILNHPSLESSLSFLLANRLQSPAMMISTQLQSLIYASLQRCPIFRRALRADLMAVRDRDPAVQSLPDVFLYFKGFHALESHRVAHTLWKKQNKRVLAQYLQSQVSQTFQIDIHPNATFGMGIMLDHGTGIVVGETAAVGHNCSILHHVTLGGSGKKGVDRHPRVGNGVLLGAGATVLGPVHIGDGSQVGAGTLVISDLPSHCVAVGVPARIIGSFIDVTEQPSIGMNQIMDENRKIVATFESDGI